MRERLPPMTLERGERERRRRFRKVGEVIKNLAYIRIKEKII
jgi:uncharacterized protein YkuJ